MRFLTAIILFATLTHFASAGPALANTVEGNFNRMDNSGGYHFGYNTGNVAHQEERTPDGLVRGAYTYIGADGKVQIVSYTAGKEGFMVFGSNQPRIGRIPEDGEFGDIIETPPAAIMETEEVARARADHLEAVRKAQAGEVELPKNNLVPVTETPEVAAARIDHLNRHKFETIRNSLTAPSYYGYPYVHQPLVYRVVPTPDYRTGLNPYYGF